MCLTTSQIAELLFVDTRGPNGQLRRDDTAHRAARRALEQLWQSELIVRTPVTLVARRAPNPYASFVYVLTPKGAAVLHDHYEQIASDKTVQWTPQVYDLINHHLAHRIAIYDFFVIAARACKRQGVELAAWLDDRQLAAYKREDELHFSNIPDAVLILEANGHQAVTLVEIDRGLETVTSLVGGRRDWSTKVTGFVAYLNNIYASEAFFDQMPAPTVVTVTTTRARLISLLAATRAAGGDDRFWFTTLDELDPLPDGTTDPEPAHERFWRPIWTAGASQQQRSLRQLMV